MKIMKYKLLFITLLVCGIGWAQVNITPIHTGTIASFPNWTHTSCTTAAASSNDYVKMVNASSKLITPLLDFTIYSSKKLILNSRPALMSRLIFFLNTPIARIHFVRFLSITICRW